MIDIERRNLLRLAGMAGGLYAAPGALRLAVAADAPSAPDIITGKSAKMIVHNAKLGVMETPLDLLRGERYTPKDLL